MMDGKFGPQLKRAREHHGVSIEEAAHATRMRPSMIEALEVGDIGAFPSPTYARNFLVLYGKYLRLDVKAVAAEIDTGLQVTVADYQYLTHANETTQGPARRGDFARPHRLPSWTPVLGLGALTAVVVFALLLWLNMSRIGEVAATPPPKPDDEKEAIEPVVAGALPVKVASALPIKRHVTQPALEPAPPVVQKPPTTELSIPEAPAPAPEPVIAPPVILSNQAPAPVYPKLPPPPAVTDSVVPTKIPPRQAIIGSSPTVEATPPTVAAPVAVAPARPEAISHLDGVEVRTARVISPVARLASNDAALLAQEGSAPQTPPPLVVTPIDEPDADGDTSALAKDPNTIEIEPMKKTWLVIRDQTGTTTLFEDFLYPSPRPMRLPAGKYVIEVRDVDAVEIRRAGRTIAYTAGGLRLE